MAEENLEPDGRGFQFTYTYGAPTGLLGAWHHIVYVLGASTDGSLPLAFEVNGRGKSGA